MGVTTSGTGTPKLLGDSLYPEAIALITEMVSSEAPDFLWTICVLFLVSAWEE